MGEKSVAMSYKDFILVCATLSCFYSAAVLAQVSDILFLPMTSQKKDKKEKSS